MLDSNGNGKLDEFGDKPEEGKDTRFNPASDVSGGETINIHYTGNLKVGDHQLVAFFEGKGPNNRDYKRGANLKFASSSMQS